MSVALPRSSGILLHVTSLPGPYGIGDLGSEARRFADFLEETGQRIWQTLPLVPVGLGDSPYASPSTFALNPLFASPELLVEDGLLPDDPIPPCGTPHRVDFEVVHPFKEALLERAFARFEMGRTPVDPAAFDTFCQRHAHWLDDYALFMALRVRYGRVNWTLWPPEIVRRDPGAIERFRRGHAEHIRQVQFAQFVLYDQWRRLKRYCNDRGIALFGDLPIYVAHDSADVWVHRDLFSVDPQGRCTLVGGVPPDHFSKTGQNWQTPIYRWDAMRDTGYAWWTQRFENILHQVDMVRVDHFIGFSAYWEIPATETTAVIGRWVQGPGANLFKAVEKRLGPLPLVAENLGLVTPETKAIMAELGFPGMAVLQYGFSGEASNPNLPHDHERKLVAYTGTHDNDTFLGWWKELMQDPSKEREAAFARAYLGLNDPGAPLEKVHWAALRAVSASPADYVVFPLQDVLGLGQEARMNRPGTVDGNWVWRFTGDQLTETTRARLQAMTALHGRSDRLDEALEAMRNPRALR